MINKRKILILSVLISGMAFSQFKSDVKKMSTPEGLHFEHEQHQSSLFSPERFSMNHGFGVSMMSMGGQSFSASAYTNTINWAVRDNLFISSRVSYVLPSMASKMGSSNLSDGFLQYGIDVNYRPTENTALYLSFQNHPRYFGRQNSMFGMGGIQ